MSKTRSSASGDRNDFIGKVPQFELFTHFVYVELTRRNLAWIKVGDPKAGNADDIQYATHTEIRAYQVKWSQQTKILSFRFLEFLQLFPKLKDSWEQIQKSNGGLGLPVYIYLLTNRPASIYKKLVVNEKGIGSFADFIKDAWPIIQSGNELQGDWKAFLAQELEEIKLSEKDFYSFARHLRLELDVTLPQPLDYKHHDIYRQDVTNLYKFFHDDLAKLDGQVKFTTDELVRKMQWPGRIKNIFSHDFYVDPRTYQPNTQTIEKLSAAIDTFSGGYIFLEGGPGSGKSSLLTQWAAGRSEKVIKYFAYLNQRNGNQPIRGDAVNLFHDLSIQLSESGFFGNTLFGVHRDTTLTQQIFQYQLEQVGELYHEKGTRTIIIIDGLDHIPREYAKQGTLLEHLPHPNDIPEGVYIILGSQSFDLTDLVLSVKEAYEHEDRKISVQPLLPVAVRSIADGVLDSSLNPTHHDLLFQASGGHPLYLQYILRTIRNDSKPSSIEEKLASLPIFDPDISRYYDKIWKEFETDEDIADLLGLVCRLRFGFHFDMSSEWKLHKAVARKARRWFNQFFDDSFGFKVFFHNSFRQFLLNKTAENPLNGKYDDTIHTDYHSRLADWSATSNVRLFRHEHLYHVQQAGQTVRFHTALTADYIDQQRYLFRPFDSIREDLSIGLQLAAEAQDLQLVIKYGFLMGELHRREWNMDQSSFIDLFPNLFDFESITEYALLPINSPERRSRAFQIARLLYHNDYEADARRLFTLAEPAVYTEGKLVVDAENGLYWQKQADPLEQWVRTTSLWADPIELLEKVLNVEVIRNGTDRESIERERRKNQEEVQVRLLDAFIESLSQTQFQTQKLLTVFGRFDYGLEGNFKFFLPRLQNVVATCLLKNEYSLVKSLVNLFVGGIIPESIVSKERVQVAKLLYDTDPDSKDYQLWINDITLEPLTEIPLGNIMDRTLDFYWPYYHLIVLQTINHQPVDLSILFPSTNSKGYDPVVTEWFKMLGRVAVIKGEGLRGAHFNLFHLQPIVRFYYTFKPHRTQFGQSRVDSLRKLYYCQVIEASAAFGRVAVSKTATFFEEEINKHPENWSVELQLDIWIAFKEHGLDEIRVKHLIDGIAEDVIAAQGDLDGRMNSSVKLSETYLDLRHSEVARGWLRRSMDESFGIGYSKDHQLNDWIGWLKRINEKEPQNARSRIRWLVSYLDYINRISDGAALGQAAYGLLECCIDWNPTAGLELFDWLLKRKYVDVDDGINLLLEKLLTDEVSPAFLARATDLFGKVLLFSSTRVSRNIFNKIITLLQKHNQNDLITELIEDVERYSLAENRLYYYEMLREANVTFIPSKGFPIERLDRDRESVATIRLRNDLRFTQLEFAGQYDSASELKDIILQYDDTSGEFDWRICIQKVENEIDEEWVIDMVSSIKLDRRGSFRLILALGELSHQKGYREATKLVASTLLELEDTSWSPFHDGGRRLRAFEFAMKVEGEPARKAAWLDFVDKFQYSSTIELLRELDEILPVLNPDADAHSIWEEVETYLKRVFANAEVGNDVPELLYESPDNDPDSLLAQMAINISLIAERGLRETALVHLAKQAATGNVSYINEIRRFANDVEAGLDQEIFAKIALYLGDAAPDILLEFTHELERLSRSSLFGNQAVAYRLLHQLDIPVNPNPLIRLPLSWLNTTAGAKNNERELRQFGHALSEGWNGPRFSIEYLYDLLDYHLDMIGRVTHIDSEILFGRAIDLLADELRKENSRLKELAKGGEIKLETTHSPYVAIIPFAIDRLLSELWEAGHLPSIEEFAWLNPLFDQKSLDFEHHRRPESLPGVRGFKDYYTLPPGWVDQAEEGFSHFINQLGERIVIAERTVFRGLGWELDTETRESCLCIDEGEESHGFGTGAFTRKVDWMVEDYVNMCRISSEQSSASQLLIIANHATRLLDTPSYICGWIAINPEIANMLEWKLADPLKFQWVDTNGDIMVESFFWVNGNIRMQPPKLKSQAGCGWILTASSEAFDQIKSRFKLIRKLYLSRNSQDKSSGENHHKTLTRIEQLTPNQLLNKPSGQA